MNLRLEHSWSVAWIALYVMAALMVLTSMTSKLYDVAFEYAIIDHIHQPGLDH